jgi:hypothetical protein
MVQTSFDFRRTEHDTDMNIAVFWVVALMMEAASTSETSVNFYTAQQPRRQPSS